MGYGASGRNGGWCSALFPASLDSLAALSDREGALAQHAAMRESVAELARAADGLGIDAHVSRGRHRRPGPLPRAAGPCPRRGRPRPQLGHRRGRAAAARRAGRPGAARRQRHHRCDVHPRLRRDPPAPAGPRPGRLAGRARGRRPRAHPGHGRVEPGRVETASGRVTAGTVVRATEGWTSRLPGHRRDVVPVYSLVIATEPLPAATWERIGLARRETFTDHRHLIIYGQRTADDRLVFGGRGAPYHFGSRVEPAVRPRRPGLRRAAGDAGRAVPGAARRPGHPRLGRAARRRPRLVRVGRPGPGDADRLGGRVRRGRGQHDQPGRPHPARPGARAATPT